MTRKLKKKDSLEVTPTNTVNKSQMVVEFSQTAMHILMGGETAILGPNEATLLVQNTIDWLDNIDGIQTSVDIEGVDQTTVEKTEIQLDS